MLDDRTYPDRGWGLYYRVFKGSHLFRIVMLESCLSQSTSLIFAAKVKRQPLDLNFTRPPGSAPNLPTAFSLR